MARNPLCVDCLAEGRTQVVEEVHHLDGRYDNNLESNLCSLCASCHGKRTRGKT